MTEPCMLLAKGLSVEEVLSLSLSSHRVIRIPAKTSGIVNEGKFSARLRRCSDILVHTLVVSCKMVLLAPSRTTRRRVAYQEWQP